MVPVYSARLYRPSSWHLAHRFSSSSRFIILDDHPNLSSQLIAKVYCPSSMSWFIFRASGPGTSFWFKFNCLPNFSARSKITTPKTATWYRAHHGCISKVSEALLEHRYPVEFPKPANILQLQGSPEALHLHVDSNTVSSIYHLNFPPANPLSLSR